MWAGKEKQTHNQEEKMVSWRNSQMTKILEVVKKDFKIINMF